MNQHYKSKTYRRAGKTILHSTDDEQKRYQYQEDELLKGEQKPNKARPAITPATRDSSAHKSKGAFDGIGDHLEDEDLSEIRLDMKEGGQSESLMRMKR